jgi:ABC-type antimicrobial peptide transport system permease subunit
MSERGWVRGLLGLARRVLTVTVVAVLVFAVIGLLLGGVDGAKAAVVWGLLAGGLSIPVLLEAMVSVDGDGVNKESRAAYFDRFFGMDTKD